MKTNYIFKVILTLGIFICLTLTTNAQIRFVEVNPSTETVTIKNFGGSTVDISSYKLCVFPNYPQLSSLSVTSGSLNLTAGAEVTVISSTNLIDAGGELGLYINTSDFSNSANIRDYIQWISIGGTRESVAVNALIWNAGTAIPNTVTPPYQYNGDGTTNNDGQSFWGSTLSIEKFSINNFSITPNPSHSFIKLNFSASTTQASVEVFDILGKQIYSSKNILDSEINVSNWNTGMYLIKASSLGNTKTKRFIKQ